MFFDLENLVGHGNTEDDVIPGLPTGCENINEQKGGVHNLRNGKAWHSRSWSQRGAALKVSSMQPGSTDEKSSTLKLGLRLLTELMGTDGDDEPGWEKMMIWLEPVRGGS